MNDVPRSAELIGDGEEPRGHSQCMMEEQNLGHGSGTLTRRGPALLAPSQPATPRDGSGLAMQTSARPEKC
jgi:hypothetical protein